jgi:predicted DNA-binding transcriptional regulator YafY
MSLRPIPKPKTATRLGRTPGKFTQSRRLDHLRAQLESHAAGLTLEDMAGMLRVSTRSVRRYLRELGRITELESVEVKAGGAHVWRIKPSERGKAVPLRKLQAYALLATRRVFDLLKGSALYDEIDLAMRQVEQVAQRPPARVAPRGDPSPEARLEGRFLYVPALPRAYASRSEDFDEVFRALAEQRLMRFRFGTAIDAQQLGGGGAPPSHKTNLARVRAHPYAIVLQSGGIACIGRDCDRNVARAFPFERMSEIEVSDGERFELPADFDVGEWLQGDFGVARAAKSIAVLVEFDARAAEAVRTRRVHPTQRLLVSADGRVRATFQVPETPEVLERVRSWVLGFGASAQVIEPKELADEVAVELARAAAKYA